MVEPRAPWWMDIKPRADETFVDFWERAGFSLGYISRALTTRYAGAEAVANERLAAQYARRHPVLYETRLNQFLVQHGF